MSEHLEHCKEVAFKQRVRTSGTLCALGLLFVSGLDIGVGAALGAETSGGTRSLSNIFCLYMFIL